MRQKIERAIRSIEVPIEHGAVRNSNQRSGGNGAGNGVHQDLPDCLQDKQKGDASRFALLPSLPVDIAYSLACAACSISLATASGFET